MWKKETGTNVVAFDVEVGEGDCDSMLRRRHYQPDAVLVWRIYSRIERTCYRSVGAVDITAARVCTF